MNVKSFFNTPDELTIAGLLNKISDSKLLNPSPEDIKVTS